MDKNKVCIDISHPAQFNFYINAIKELSNTYKVLVTIIDRGNLVDIAKKELKNVSNAQLIVVGSHHGGAWSIIVQANMLKFFRLILVYLRGKPIVQLSNHYIAGMVAKMFNVPSIQMQDDIERSFLMRLQLLASDQFSIPKFIGEKNSEIKYFNALKEWAYLSPDFFKPEDSILDKYGLEPYKYIFVREVSNKSFNYQNQSSNLISKFTKHFPENYRVLLSLEEKETVDKYPNDWILLEEPIENFHSLLYFSRMMISSGDSMAREGGLLGVPSLYCGIRTMKANEVLIDKGMLYHTDIQSTPRMMCKILGDDQFLKKKKMFREDLKSNWDNVTKFIIESVESHLKKII